MSIPCFFVRSGGGCRAEEAGEVFVDDTLRAAPTPAPTIALSRGPVDNFWIGLFSIIILKLISGEVLLICLLVNLSSVVNSGIVFVNELQKATYPMLLTLKIFFSTATSIELLTSFFL